MWRPNKHQQPPMWISNLIEEHWHEDLSEHEEHKCGYENNNAKTSMVDRRNIKIINMETCLSANLKFIT